MGGVHPLYELFGFWLRSLRNEKYFSSIIKIVSGIFGSREISNIRLETLETKSSFNEGGGVIPEL